MKIITADNKELKYKSSSKHSLGGKNNRHNTGIEPKNSLELFKTYFASVDGKHRYAVDANGKAHRFEEKNNVFHWNRSSSYKKIH